MGTDRKWDCFSPSSNSIGGDLDGDVLVLATATSADSEGEAFGDCVRVEVDLQGFFNGREGVELFGWGWLEGTAKIAAGDLEVWFFVEPRNRKAKASLTRRGVSRFYWRGFNFQIFCD